MFHLLFEVGFFPFYEHRFFELHLVFSSCRVQDLEAVRSVRKMFGKTLNFVDV